MGFSNRHILSGKINNESINKYRFLNYKENNLDERLKYINDLLSSKTDDKGRNFFEIYFDEKYKPELSQSDELSENNNVCQTLEKMANYLLGSDEIRELRNKERQKYFFYIDRDEFKKRTSKELSLENMTSSMSSNKINDIESNTDNAIHFLLNTNHNFKKSKNQVITRKDINENSRCGEVLRDYNNYLEFITKEIKDPVLYPGMRNKLTRIKNSVSQDMLLSKTSLKGTFGEKLRNALPEGPPNIDWDRFDWLDYKQIRELLLLSSKNLECNSDLYHLILDLKMLLKEMNNLGLFTEKEIETLSYILKGFSQSEIAEVLNVTRQRINYLMAHISKEISRYTYYKYNLLG